MTTRSRRETVHFRNPFRIKGIDRLLPPSGYEVVTDGELIEGTVVPELSLRRHHDHGGGWAAARNDLDQFDRSVGCAAYDWSASHE